MSKFVGIMMKYPIGIQSFEQLREDGYVYVDKTDLVYKLVTTGKIYFLSRPRRFGKSLLVSTLKNYFLGRRDLFEGLAISSLEKESIRCSISTSIPQTSRNRTRLGHCWKRLSQHGRGYILLPKSSPVSESDSGKC